MEKAINKGNQIFENIKKGLSSIYAVPFIFVFAFICSCFESYNLSVLVLASLASIILLICDDVKNIFAICFYACFYIATIEINPDWVCYGIAIGIVGISFICFIIRKLIINEQRKNLKKGRMFFPIIISSIAFLLGGLISNFQFLPFIITFGFCFATITFYWLAVNFTKDLGKYLLRVFVLGAVLVALIMYMQNVRLGKNFFEIITSTYYMIGAQNPNVAALFMTLGLIACFFVAKDKKYRGIFFVVASLLQYSIIITTCRMMCALSVICFASLTVYTLIKTQYRLRYIFSMISVLILALMIFLVDPTVFDATIVDLLSKAQTSGWNGRDVLWGWCINKFIEHPIFGYGFIVPIGEEVPAGSIVFNRFILAHNTLLQWLCSLGLVGTALMGYFYFKKYKLVLKNLFGNLAISLIILIIEINGLFDQSPAMDTFIYLIVIVCLASIETNKVKQKSQQKPSEKDNIKE